MVAAWGRDQREKELSKVRKGIRIKLFLRNLCDKCKIYTNYKINPVTLAIGIPRARRFHEIVPRVAWVYITYIEEGGEVKRKWKMERWGRV